MTHSLLTLSQQAQEHAQQRPAAHIKQETWRNVKIAALEKDYNKPTTATTAANVAQPVNLPYEQCIVLHNGISEHPLCAKLIDAQDWHQTLTEHADLSSQWILTQAQQHYAIKITSDQQLCIYNRATDGHSASSISLSVASGVRCDVLIIHDVDGAHDDGNLIVILHHNLHHNP